MNFSTRSIWSDLPLSAGIATLVCYAGVFDDVLGIEELASRLGVSGQDDFYVTLEAMRLQGTLVVRDGFVALPDREDRIGIKASKIATAHRLINSRLGCLRRLERNPLVRFVGISGSLAAANPIRDRHNQLDIDIFVITRHHCLWLYNILRGFRNLLHRSKQEPELCINYVIDESHLLIANRNLFTATEIRNLIPLSKSEVYRKFLQINGWVDCYYPGFSGASGPVPVTPSGDLTNKCLYLVYTIFRCIKWLSLDPIKGISLRNDPHRGNGPDRVSPPYGGYQTLVQKKFSRLAEAWFPKLLDAELIERLFPDKLSAKIREGSIDGAGIFANAGAGPDYSKYGWQYVLPKGG